MGKYDIKKKKTKEMPLWLIPVCAILIPILIIGFWALTGRDTTPPSPTTPTQTTPQGTTPQDTTPVTKEPTFPAPTTLPEETLPDNTYLGNGLEIDYIGPYAGIYMEDGTDDIVSNMMMLILKNTSDQDLQLARINLHYADFVANFEVTNLPAGESVVLLERNRHEYVDRRVVSAEAQNVLFFSEPMSLMEDTFSFSGGPGYIEITNTSSQDITAETFVYYKNSATDLLYGGITYRVRLSDGVRAGETLRLMTNHYHPDRCTILMVTSGE